MAGQPLNPNQRALLRAVAAAGGTKVVPHRDLRPGQDNRQPWRIQQGGPGWKSATFYTLKHAGYLTMDFSADGLIVEVGITDAGRAAIGLPVP